MCGTHTELIARYTMPDKTSPPSLSIIIPVLNESATIVHALDALQDCRRRGVELIVVDGGSTDRTRELAAAQADLLVSAPSGRGCQMNAGAVTAQGKVLLFLHADTELPPTALQRIHEAIAKGAIWGRFDVRISGRHPGLWLVGFMMNWRSRFSGIATGDQGIFVTRDAFHQVGGFPDIPLMEDIVFSDRLRAIARPACIGDKVHTSGRRWEKHGLLNTIVMMWRLRLRFHYGADPQELAREYGYAPRRD